MRQRNTRRTLTSFETLEARCLLTITPGLLGEYFNEINLTGLADTRVDLVVNFPQDWGDAPPGTAVVPDDNYSERWTGWVLIQSHHKQRRRTTLGGRNTNH